MKMVSTRFDSLHTPLSLCLLSLILSIFACMHSRTCSLAQSRGQHHILLPWASPLINTYNISALVVSLNRPFISFLRRTHTLFPTYPTSSFSRLATGQKNPAYALRIHAHLTLCSPHLHDALGNPLVVTLAKCGALEEALRLLYSLSNRTVLSWTAIISAYTECGHASDALQMHARMLDDGIQPDVYTFVSLFKACGSLQNLTEGMRMHADAHKKGFTSNAFVGSSLVSMYGKCQSLDEAESVFVEMSEHDIVLWSAMLSAYVDMGCGKKALQLYRQMQDEFQNMVKLLLVLALQACSCLEEDEDPSLPHEQSVQLMAFDIGCAIHADACKRGFVSDVFIGSALIHLYGKCGTILHAENVFITFSAHDLAMWNSMLSAYVEQSQAIAALQLYKQLHGEGMNASKVTLLIALKACTIFAEEEEVSIAGEKQTKAISSLICQAFHQEALKKELASDVFVGSALITLFGKCGNTLEAENVFSRLVNCNVVSWTAMMSSYLEQGEENKVLQAYRQMQDERMTLDQHISVLGIQACSILLEKPETSVTTGLRMVLNIGQALHAEARMRGFTANIYICSALISMYGKCEKIAEAENVFCKLSGHNVVSWTALLSAYAEQGEEVKALQVYYQMQKEGIYPDGTVCVLALQVCCSLGEKGDNLCFQGQTARITSLQIGKGLHADCKRFGLASDVAVGNALLLMYGKCGSIVDAVDVFKELPQHDVVVCSFMLSAYIDQGLSEIALHMFKHMLNDNVMLDDSMLFCIMKACSDIGNLEMCWEVYFSIVSAGLDSFLMLSNTLIHTYGSCASMLDGQFVADRVLQPDIVSWSACVAGYAQEGSSETALRAIVSMQLEGNQPEGMTFLSLLTSCSHTGLVVEGLEYLESMGKDYGIAMDSKHYLVLMDLLGRAGDFKRLEWFLHRSPMKVDVSLWLVLLAACVKHGNKELGKRAFYHVVDLEPRNTAVYVLMANIFTETNNLVWS